MRRVRRTATRARLLVTLLCVASLAGCTQVVFGTGTPATPSSAPGGSAAASSSAAPQDLTPVDPLAPVPDPPTPTIQWADCTSLIKPQLSGVPGGDRDLQFSCGQMAVPVDYADPTGPTLTLVLTKTHLNGSDPKGSLVVNPGGPGGGGALFGISLALSIPEKVLQNFDLVGFDPRGVGESAPITCLSNGQKDAYFAAVSDPQDAAQEKEYADGLQALSAGCASRYPNIEHLNTVETARDLDQIRRGVGDKKLTYLGYSYGTELGGVYATLFPERIRALVLDGAVDPTIDGVQSAQADVKGFQNAFDRFAAACQKFSGGCKSGADPEKTALALIQSADADPIPTSEGGDDRTATGSNVFSGILSALYDEGQWPALDAAIASGTDGDAKGLFALADSLYGRSVQNGKVVWTNLVDANTTINCNDTTETYTLDEAKAYADQWRTESPLFGGVFGWGLAGCAEWKVRRHPEPKVSAPSAPTVLVVGTKNDPATPYSGAVNLTKALGSARLLSWEGDGHTAYPKTTCVSDAVDAYLIDLTLPAEGTDCPA